VTTHLFALGRRATSITIAGALTLSILAMAPAAAHADAVQTRTPLHEGAGMTGRPDARTLAVQRTLLRRGYDLGAGGADGRFGPLTAAAVRRFQARAGLVVDGIVGRRTRLALTTAPKKMLREGVGMGSRPSVVVRRLQRALLRVGFRVGPSGADGRFGPLTADAVRRMQVAHGLTPDGIVGPKTRRALHWRGSRRSTRQPIRRPSTSPVGAGRRRAVHDQSASDNDATQTAAQWTASVIALVALLVSGAALAVAVRRPAEPRPSLLPAGFAEHATPSNGDDPGLQAGSRALEPAPLRSGPPSGGVIGYLTLDEDGRPPPASLDRLCSVCANAGLELDEVVRDSDAPSLFARPGLVYAREKVAAGRSQALVVNDIKRLAPTLDDLGTLLEWFRDAGAVIVVPDLELDTATVEGDRIASEIITDSKSQRDGSSEPIRDHQTRPVPDADRRLS
jgi:peptidoglycan hydrolase-like protein with peptidoglycan-binding domain